MEDILRACKRFAGHQDYEDIYQHAVLLRLESSGPTDPRLLALQAFYLVTGDGTTGRSSDNLFKDTRRAEASEPLKWDPVSPTDYDQVALDFGLEEIEFITAALRGEDTDELQNSTRYAGLTVEYALKKAKQELREWT